MASWKERASKIKVGDRVAYSAKWLRLIGADTTHVAQQRGTVIEINPFRSKLQATVDFHDGLPPLKILTDDLSRVTERILDE
jgi:hypothetical protein